MSFQDRCAEAKKNLGNLKKKIRSRATKDIHARQERKARGEAVLNELNEADRADVLLDFPDFNKIFEIPDEKSLKLRWDSGVAFERLFFG